MNSQPPRFPVKHAGGNEIDFSANSAWLDQKAVREYVQLGIFRGHSESRDGKWNNKPHYCDVRKHGASFSLFKGISNIL